MRRLNPDTQPHSNIQMQENEENLIPFAKYSRVVSRTPPPSLPAQSLRLTPKHYGDFFWENISQRPSPTWMEEQYFPPQLRVSARSQLDLYRPEGLLPPEMLCRRKRRSHLSGVRRGTGGTPARVRAVTYHLEDLRRRQRIINDMKEAQWGSSGAAAASVPLMLAEDDCGFPSATQCPDLEEERAPYPLEQDHHLTPGRAQLLWSPWTPLGHKGSHFSRCQASCSTGTPLYNPWEPELQSEE
ncbi:protein INCA1 isoform X1 [Sorex araneus]|uniref:protein INCA1 isoform X1 n=1 Tax=Sorex araneus TaxID=42254 RepID=UPI0024336C84|nr:protein INCA1 isoform X1 [Sorex araneus]